MLSRLLAVVAAVLVLTGCSDQPTSAPTSPQQARSEPALPELARDLRVPWGVGFLPNGNALIAERDTRAVILRDSDGQRRPVGTITEAEPNGEGGLLGLAVSPEFASDQRVYVYYSTPTENRIAVATFNGERLSPARPIVRGIPSASRHDGGQLTFGPDGMLYAATGDATRDHLAQDRQSLAGKILRMTPEGTPAQGNPFGDSLVYSYGHRNIEGLAFDSRGRLWASEFGANTFDELNLIQPGGNYGWPEVEGMGDDPRFINPKAQWETSESSPADIAIVGDVIYMANLRGESVFEIPIEGDRVGRVTERFAEQYGRLRTIEPAPDGSLWLTTSNHDGRGDPRPGDDRILRVAPR